MIRRTLPLLSLLLLASAACDSDSTIVLVPEFQESFDFESSLQGWEGASGDLPTGTSVSVAHTSTSAAEGQGSVQITTSAEETGGKVWIARAFQVTAEQPYEVTVTFDLGTDDGAMTIPWDVVSSAGSAPPTAAGLVVQGGTTPESPTGERVWDSRTHTLLVTSGAGDGETATVWIAVGLGVATAGDRTYGVDELEVSFLRAS